MMQNVVDQQNNNQFLVHNLITVITAYYDTQHVFTDFTTSTRQVSQVCWTFFLQSSDKLFYKPCNSNPLAYNELSPWKNGAAGFT